MSRIECPKAHLHRSKSSRWQATGQFNTNHSGLRRAALRCLEPDCGYYWSSARREAIEAGDLVANDPELMEGNAIPIRVPQPSLPMQVPRGKDFVRAKAVAKASQFAHLIDAKKKAAGE